MVASVQSVGHPQPPLATAARGFIPAFPLESADTYGFAPITEPRGKQGKLPLLILSPGQRVDLLNNERARLISEYDRAVSKQATRQAADIASALREVTNQIMRRQLIAKGAIHA